MKQLSELGEHQAAKSHEVQCGQRRGEPLVVAGQAAEGCRPGEAAPDHWHARIVGAVSEQGSASRIGSITRGE